MLTHLTAGDKDQGPLQSPVRGCVWERVLPPAGLDGDGVPRDTKPDRSSNLQRVKDLAAQ